ncbi:ATP-grasp domain-containing protein [Deinococcus sp. KNUC1210]|uniref:ATP-grasp domain-containing protein n=1 Tax=Deinococcus sp. KNUC1210 TaxID=2917691 RepID=UPI001EF1350C|nr:ATP-grasp domain-containing protein [Deinococcus sp. KNUC1210]ULH14367.1 ATP-grasp domain-containing protein [Deinococcus sp. KNUC1210]
MPTIYFNKNFSVTSAQLEQLRLSGQFTTLASHSDPSSAMLGAADRALTEPRGLLGTPYVEWLLATVRRERPQVFLVGKEAGRVAERRADFEALGTRVIAVADAPTLRLLDRKDEFLTSWDDSILPIPAWTTFHDAASFEAGIERLRSHPGFVPGSTRLCIKPARGIYAAGFRVLTEGRTLKSFLRGELYQMSLEEARRMFGLEETFPTMLLMHTLEGAERSVDCVAWQGELAAAVVRRKLPDGGPQYLEDRPDLLEAARRLTRAYQLSGIFNFQTKDDAQRRPNMLEINARASGGLRYSMAAGLDFAGVAAALSLGLLRAQDAPTPRTDLHVNEVKQARVLQAATTLEDGPELLDEEDALA